MIDTQILIYLEKILFLKPISNKGLCIFIVYILKNTFTGLKIKLYINILFK